ncbi:MAG: hypothetical protein OXC30_05075, partial [Alphaproteobacteria bacterium]|nr:hypothetical protein [Alphaproteobacteria bacterium]
EKAQELLDPYRGVLTLPAASLDTNDLDQLRGLAEPILATLKRAQDETNYGSNEVMIRRNAFYRFEDQFEGDKQNALRASSDGNFYCDMETFFYFFSELEEKYDVCANKGIARYMTPKYIDAYHSLLLALRNFCKEHVRYATEYLRSYWGSYNQISCCLIW